MDFLFNIAAIVSGIISAILWFYASQIPFRMKSDKEEGEEEEVIWQIGGEGVEVNGTFHLDGQRVPHVGDMSIYLEKIGRINAMAALFTGMASLFSVLSIAV